MNGCLLLRLGNGFSRNNFRTKEGDFVATFGVNNTGPSVASKGSLQKKKPGYFMTSCKIHLTPTHPT